MHDAFIVNEDKLKELMSDVEKQTLLVNDLIVFKKKADDIVGFELDSFIEYLINNTDKSKLYYVRN